ncbi:ILRUN isoform X3 [Pelobates cultripes]|uniref:ILRUN isoform X3 n=1 Tax=Pelobates cultripes TaxID=61616 RepID=A0AAD1VJI1_PELCU|nr:ILRUN isoform X3 [Pelobates cultripes]
MEGMDVDLDPELLQKFSCLGTTDKDVLISEFQRLLGFQLNPAGCAFFLDMTNWNLQAAIGAYYDFESPSVTVPCMSFVEDVTIGEGESVPPDTQFTKTWRIQNTAWDRGHQNLMKVSQKKVQTCSTEVDPISHKKLNPVGRNARMPNDEPMQLSNSTTYQPINKFCVNLITLISLSQISDPSPTSPPYTPNTSSMFAPYQPMPYAFQSNSLCLIHAPQHHLIHISPLPDSAQSPACAPYNEPVGWSVLVSYSYLMEESKINEITL